MRNTNVMILMYNALSLDITKQTTMLIIVQPTVIQQGTYKRPSSSQVLLMNTSSSVRWYPHTIKTFNPSAGEESPRHFMLLDLTSTTS
jgi:hypothetical protein